MAYLECTLQFAPWCDAPSLSSCGAMNLQWSDSITPVSDQISLVQVCDNLLVIISVHCSVHKCKRTGDVFHFFPAEGYAYGSQGSFIVTFPAV
jgi:hypothetical protein